MKTRPCALAVLLALTAPSATGITRALAADDAATRSARARFQEGVAAFDKGQYDAARVAFLQAYTLRKHPAVLLNLAMSCLRGGRWLEASRYFQQYLRDARDAAPAQRESAVQGIAEARSHLGHIDAQGPAGTELYVDDERAGVLPLDEGVDVEPGAQSVRLRAPDGREETQALSLRPGDRAAVRMPPPAPPAPTPPPQAPAEPVAAPAPPPEAPAEEPSSASAAESTRPSLLAPPADMTPFWVSSGLAVAGIAVGVVFGIQRDVAQGNADRVEEQIRSEGGGPGVCTTTDPRLVARFGEACDVLADNRSIVNLDATLANAGFIVGGAAAAFAVGWYLLAPKEESAPSGVGSLRVTPFGLMRGGGVALSGQLP